MHAFEIRTRRSELLYVAHNITCSMIGLITGLTISQFDYMHNEIIPKYDKY